MQIPGPIGHPWKLPKSTFHFSITHLLHPERFEVFFSYPPFLLWTPEVSLGANSLSIPAIPISVHRTGGIASAFPQGNKGWLCFLHLPLQEKAVHYWNSEANSWPRLWRDCWTQTYSVTHFSSLWTKKCLTKVTWGGEGCVSTQFEAAVSYSSQVRKQRQMNAGAQLSSCSVHCLLVILVRIPALGTVLPSVEVSLPKSVSLP